MKNTLTKAVLTEKLCNQLGLSKVEVQGFIEAMFEVISSTIENGEVVKLSGFGNFVPLDKGDRLGRNPKTGEGVVIEKRRVVTFRAGNKLKKMVEQAGGEGVSRKRIQKTTTTAKAKKETEKA
jgi:integration host factor subunit alpha